MNKNKFEVTNLGSKEESRQKKVFIEIGTNQLPVPWLGKKKFGEDEVYIGVERARDEIYEARENVRDVVKNAENIHFIRADAKKLPLQNASADEIFLGNVLGDPSIQPDAKDKFVEESKRVLKKGGVIIIKETNTPPTLRWFDDFLKKHGLRVKKGVESGSPGWEELVAPYQGNVSLPFAHRDSFIVFVEPLSSYKEEK